MVAFFLSQIKTIWYFVFKFYKQDNVYSWQYLSNLFCLALNPKDNDSFQL